MKITKKMLLIAAFFALVIPMIFTAGDARAYIGDEMCISCHTTPYMTVRSTVDADPAAFLEMYNVGGGYLQTGHKNTVRLYDGVTAPLGPDGNALAGLTPAMKLVHHSWFDGNSYRNVKDTDTAGFGCTPCHTTGFKGDETAANTAATLGIQAVGNNGYHLGATGLDALQASGGSFALPGVQCEACHGERALNVYECASVGYRWRLRSPGVVDLNADGDMCDSGERVQTYFCGSSFEFADRFTMTATELDGTTPFTVPADVDTCGGVAVNSGHHSKVAGAVDIYSQVEGAATGAEIAAAINPLCGQCHMTEHDAMQNFQNSAHSKFTGTMNLNDYSNPAKYDANQFTDTYGSCNGCHNPHKTVLTTVPGVEEGAITGCADCHQDTNPDVVLTTMTGFHDTLLAEGTMPSTVEGGIAGANSDSCLACHTSGGRDHVFRISSDVDYDGNRLTTTGGLLDPPTGYTEAECKALPGYQSWSSTSSNGRCRYYALDSNGQISRGMINACGACHTGATALTDSTLDTVVANGGYHAMDLDLVACADCHTTVVGGTDHHTGTCTDCHDAGEADGRARHDGTAPATTNASCLTCHDSDQGAVTAINPDTNHHGSTQTCIGCHTEPGATVPATTNTACLACHSTAQGAVGKIVLADLNHQTGAGTPTSFTDSCAKCHDAGDTKPGGEVDVASTCGQCHITGTAMPLTVAQLGLVADGIHDAAGSCNVTFTASQVTNTLNVSVDANATSVLVAATPITYNWTWEDGPSIGETATLGYTSAGSKSIKVTVKDADGKSVCSTTRNITVKAVDLVPTAAISGTCTWDADNWSMTIIDASTDDGADADAALDTPPTLNRRVTWGDGSYSSSGTQGVTFTKNYCTAGTSTPSMRVTDTKRQGNTYTCTAAAARSYFTYSGTVNKSAGGIVTYATVKLQQTSSVGGCALISQTKSTVSTGAFSFTNLKPGTYSITVTKTGYTFPTTTIEVGPSDTTGNVITASTP